MEVIKLIKNLSNSCQKIRLRSLTSRLLFLELCELMKSFWIPFTGPKKLRKMKEILARMKRMEELHQKKEKEHQETVAALNKSIEDLQGVVFNRFSQG